MTLSFHKWRLLSSLQRQNIHVRLTANNSINEGITMKMNPVVKEQWAVALESGNYRKSHACLKRDHPVAGVCHCAIGVLAEVLGVPSEKVETSKLYIFKFYNDGVIDEDSIMPPQHWLTSQGISCTFADRIVGMSDQGKLFVDIADFIRNTL